MFYFWISLVKTVVSRGASCSRIRAAGGHSPTPASTARLPPHSLVTFTWIRFRSQNLRREDFAFFLPPLPSKPFEETVPRKKKENNNPATQLLSPAYRDNCFPPLLNHLSNLLLLLFVQFAVIRISQRRAIAGGVSIPRRRNEASITWAALVAALADLLS